MPTHVQGGGGGGRVGLLGLLELELDPPIMVSAVICVVTPRRTMCLVEAVTKVKRRRRGRRS